MLPPDPDSASAKVWMNTRSVEYMKAGISSDIEVSKFCRAAKKSQMKFRTILLNKFANSTDAIAISET